MPTHAKKLCSNTGETRKAPTFESPKEYTLFKSYLTSPIESMRISDLYNGSKALLSWTIRI